MLNRNKRVTKFASRGKRGMLESLPSDVINHRHHEPLQTRNSQYAVPIHKCFGVSSPWQDHYYTTNDAECTGTWDAYEGIAFWARPLDSSGNCPEDTQPVYKHWNGSNLDHFYTITPNWTNSAFVYESIAFCAPLQEVEDTVPVYQHYDAGNQDHYYTINQYFTNPAFVYEYISFYAWINEPDFGNIDLEEGPPIRTQRGGRMPKRVSRNLKGKNISIPVTDGHHSFHHDIGNTPMPMGGGSGPEDCSYPPGTGGGCDCTDHELEWVPVYEHYWSGGGLANHYNKLNTTVPSGYESQYGSQIMFYAAKSYGNCGNPECCDVCPAGFKPIWRPYNDPGVDHMLTAVKKEGYSNGWNNYWHQVPFCISKTPIRDNINQDVVSEHSRVLTRCYHSSTVDHMVRLDGACPNHFDTEGDLGWVSAEPIDYGGSDMESGPPIRTQRGGRMPAQFPKPSNSRNSRGKRFGRVRRAFGTPNSNNEIIKTQNTCPKGYFMDKSTGMCKMDKKKKKNMRRHNG